MHSEAQPITPSGDELAGDELAARQVALSLLNAVLSQKQALDHVLERDGDYNALNTRDKGFVRMMVSTTLRKLGQIDDAISGLLDRPDSLRNEILRNILRLGAVQILFMNVPEHAAVDCSVKLAEAQRLESQKGFVNGLLRNIVRRKNEILNGQDPSRLNTPEWLLKLWIEDYGLRTAAEISLANQAEAPLDITIRDEESRNHWGSVLQASSFPTGSLRLAHGGNVTEMPGFSDGAWWVQDAAAAIPAQLLGNISGKHVIDLCAAPGGKTMQLAAKGAFVTALDRSASRLKRVSENAERLGLQEKVQIINEDAGHWKPAEPPEYILLDAPCSATGTIRRHPDVPHLKSPRDIKALAATQERLLKHACDILAKGGTLIYCTCSLQKSEGEAQIEKLLASRTDMRRAPVTKEELGGLAELITPEGDVRVMPFHCAASGGMDGFFISRLTKNEGKV